MVGHYKSVWEMDDRFKATTPLLETAQKFKKCKNIFWGSNQHMNLQELENDDFGHVYQF